MSSLLSIATLEQTMLNSLRSNPEFILRLDKNYFVSALAKSIFEVQKECFLADMEPSVENLIIHGSKRNASITKELLQSLEKVNFNPDEFEQQLKLLKKSYAKDRIENHILKETLVETSKKGELNIEKIEALKNEMTEALDLIQGKESLLHNLDNMFDRYHSTLLKRRKGEQQYPTGDAILDRYLTLGFAPGHMTTFMADSGVGKSVVALNLANKQINKRVPCLYITLENNEELTMDRLVSMRTGINYEDLYFKHEGIDTERLFETFLKEKELLKTMNTFLLVDEADLSLDNIELLIKESKRRMAVDYLCVFLDLQSMVRDFTESIDPQSIEQAVNKQHRIAKRQNCHFVNVLQTNGSSVDFKPKSVKDCEKFRFTNIGNIKNARAFGERSRAVIGVVRPKMIAENVFGKENAEVEIMSDLLILQIIKQNQGRLGNIKYLFMPEKFRLYRYIEKEK
jgi:replicative DNA helicase